MNTSTTANLRRDPRIEVAVPISLLRGKKTLELTTLDVSFRGLFLKTMEPPQLRSLNRLKIRLPLRTIEVHAMAVHVIEAKNGREGGVGLQFWGLNGPDRSDWEAFVRDCARIRRNHPANLEAASGIRQVSVRPAK